MLTEEEMIINLIENYANLQRIKNVDNSEKELDCQIRVLKAKLEIFGISTKDLDID